MLIEGRTRAGLLEPLGGFRLLTDEVEGCWEEEEGG